MINGMGLSDAVNDWKDLISNIPLQYYAVFLKNIIFLFSKRSRNYLKRGCFDEIYKQFIALFYRRF
ncbi:MAG: hypothetical protein ABIS01_11175, partial [Ferruginibacter sp.]